MCVFFNLFHQSVIVFIVQILYFLVKYILKYSIVFDATKKQRDHFANKGPCS